MEKLQTEAFVFSQLVAHLQENTDVQNIDIMNTAGFCRNCLSKWYFIGANKFNFTGVRSYDDACERIYDMPYKQWKQTYQTKATQEQMDKFNASKSKHAQHPPMDTIEAQISAKSTQSSAKTPVRSNVCCELPDALIKSSQDVLGALQEAAPAVPLEERTKIVLGVVTVSDRAYDTTNVAYKDESGPEIVRLVKGFEETGKQYVVVEQHASLVPDERGMIAKAIEDLVDAKKCTLVLTTGGTGLAKRDVTPEATEDVLEKVVSGIPEMLRRETSKVEPLAMLSRGVAGVRGDALVINLPGRPKAVRENMLVLLPLLRPILQSLG